MTKLFRCLPVYILMGITVLSCNCKNGEPIQEPTTENTERSDTFTKISPTDIPGNVVEMINNEWMLITAGTKDQYNTMTASWGMMGELWGKPVTACFVRPQRYTFKFMEECEYYTLCFFDTTQYREALNFCGTKSGRDYVDQNKAEAAGLTPAFTDNGTPYFKEAWLVIECKKLYAQQFDPKNFTTDEITKEGNSLYPTLNELHKTYIGEMVNVYKR